MCHRGGGRLERHRGGEVAGQSHVVLAPSAEQGVGDRQMPSPTVSGRQPFLDRLADQRVHEGEPPIVDLDDETSGLRCGEEIERVADVLSAGGGHRGGFEVGK